VGNVGWLLIDCRVVKYYLFLTFVIKTFDFFPENEKILGRGCLKLVRIHRGMYTPIERVIMNSTTVLIMTLLKTTLPLMAILKTFNTGTLHIMTLLITLIDAALHMCFIYGYK
jgi:hypothetical protein